MIGWIASPLSHWREAPILHKLAVGGAGAGLAYLLHRKSYPWWQVAVFSVVGAYGTSMALHASAKFPAPSFSPAQFVAPAPVQQVVTETAGFDKSGSEMTPPATPTENVEEPVDDGMSSDNGIFG